MKLRKKFLVSVIALSLGAVPVINSSRLEVVTIAQASSKYLSESKAKVNHLNWSLHNNYLGIKNQGQWQEYIKGIRSSIKNIPSSEKSQANTLTASVNKAESLVNGLSRINQVEKSMESNTPRIGNVRQWNNYLTLGKQDLDKVDKGEFSKEIDKLTTRLNICENKVTSIVNEYNVKFDKVSALYKNAKSLRDKEEAAKAYNEAKNLSTCEESNMLVYKCKLLLADLGEITLTKDEDSLRNAYTILQEILSYGFDVMNTNESTIEEVIKHEVGNDVSVKVTKVLENPDKGEVVFDIVLSKGDVALYPISVVF